MGLIATTILYTLFTFVLAIVGSFIGSAYAWPVWRAFITVVGAMYLFFVLYSMVMLIAERKHTNITMKNSLICCLMSPFYWACYVPIYITAMFKRTVEWKPIIHKVQMSDDGKTSVEATLEEGVEKK